VCAAVVVAAMCVSDERFYACMLLLSVECAYRMQAPSTPPLLSSMVYALPQTHSILCYCGNNFLSWVYITLQRLLGKFVPAAAVAVCTMQAPYLL